MPTRPARIPNDGIAFESPGESLYEKESRAAERVLAKQRARKAAKRTTNAKSGRKKV